MQYPSTNYFQPKQPHYSIEVLLGLKPHWNQYLYKIGVVIEPFVNSLVVIWIIHYFGMMQSKDKNKLNSAKRHQQCNNIEGEFYGEQRVSIKRHFPHWFYTPSWQDYHFERRGLGQSSSTNRPARKALCLFMLNWCCACFSCCCTKLAFFRSSSPLLVTAVK